MSGGFASIPVRLPERLGDGTHDPTEGWPADLPEPGERLGTPVTTKPVSDAPELKPGPDTLYMQRDQDAETQAFTYLGTMFVGSPPGQAEFFAWVKERDAAPPKPTEEAEDKS